MDESISQECPEDLKPLFSQEETHLFHVALRSIDRDVVETLAASNRYLYNVGDSPKRYALAFVHSVAHDWDSKTKLKIFVFRKEKKKKGAKPHPLGSGVLITSLLTPETYECSNEVVRDDLVIRLNRVVRDYWQAILEKEFIAPPEIYQYHTVLTKVNRKGKFQIRMFSISTHRIYNIESKFSPTCVLKTCKWCFPITLLLCVVIYEDCENAFSVVIKPSDNKRVKRTYSFITLEREEKEILVHELRRLYNNILNVQLEERVIKLCDKDTVMKELLCK